MLWSCWLSPSTLPPYLRRNCLSLRSRPLLPSPESLRQQPRAQWISFARSPPVCDAAGLRSRMSKSADRRGAHAFIEGNKSADQVISSAVPGSNRVRCSARSKRLTFALTTAASRPSHLPPTSATRSGAVYDQKEDCLVPRTYEAVYIFDSTLE